VLIYLVVFAISVLTHPLSPSLIAIKEGVSGKLKIKNICFNRKQVVQPTNKLGNLYYRSAFKDLGFIRQMTDRIIYSPDIYVWT